MSIFRVQNVKLIDQKYTLEDFEFVVFNQRQRLALPKDLILR